MYMYIWIFCAMISFAIVVIVIAAASATTCYQKNNDDVKILHVIFRHGDRTPLHGHPNDKNLTFAREGGVLTSHGKNRAYKLGQLLGCRYGKILSKHKYSELLSATSSEYTRTRETLLCVLAGMFPPEPEERVSPGVNWQPIAPDYMKFKEDKLLAVMECCSTVIDINTIGPLDSAAKSIFRDIENNTGIKIENYVTLMRLKDNILVMSELGYDIPQWALPYWPELFQTFSYRGWHQLYDQYLNFIVGNLLHKIAEDSMQPLAETDRRVYLYSGHDLNVGALLHVLGAFTDKSINYTAYIAIEVIEVKGERKVLVYYDNHDEKATYLKIPGCGFDCPVDEFTKFAQKFYLGDQWCPEK